MSSRHCGPSQPGIYPGAYQQRVAATRQSKTRRCAVALRERQAQQGPHSRPPGLPMSVPTPGTDQSVKAEAARFSGFLVVGGVCTLLNLAIVYLLVTRFDLLPYLAA